MKIALFVNSAKTFFWHRKSLADKLVSEGHEVTVVCSRDGDVARFKNEPYQTILLDMSRKGKNPFKELILILDIYRTFKKIKPDICHNFTIKCVIYGSIVQRILGVKKVVNSITGLGIVFVKGGLLQSFVESLYKFCFWFSDATLIFQNPDDRELFLNRKIITSERTRLILGSGVNVDHFFPGESAAEKPAIIFASRLIRSKGVMDLLEASVLLIKENIGHKVYIAGEFDPMNPDTLTEEDFRKFRSFDHISFLGNVNDMPALFKKSDIACFPSYYREGVPKFLLEAASSGMAIVTTDAPGCREVVKDNGFLVPPKDVQALSHALKRLLIDSELRNGCSRNSRKLALEKFSETKILSEIVAVYSLASGRQL